MYYISFVNNLLVVENLFNSLKVVFFQALEGNRQLEDLIGVSLVPCSLKSEARKTKELSKKVIKQKLFEKKK